MHKVEIHYKRFGFNRHKKIDVPERWDELNEHQFAVCAQIYTGNVSQTEFIRRFYGLPSHIMRKLSGYDAYKLADLADFTISPDGLTNFFYLKEIAGLHAPADRLSGITLEHFAIFDTAFFDYVNKPGPDTLIRFVSMLYTRPGEEITRIDFDKRIKLVEKRARLSDCHAIFLNYIFIHRWLAGSFPFLFEEKEDDQEVKPRDKQEVKPAKPINPNWNLIIENFVGEDVINYNKYIKMPAIIAFKTINRRIKTLRKNGK